MVECSPATRAARVRFPADAFFCVCYILNNVFIISDVTYLYKQYYMYTYVDHGLYIFVVVKSVQCLYLSLLNFVEYLECFKVILKPPDDQACFVSIYRLISFLSMKLSESYKEWLCVSGYCS